MSSSEKLDKSPLGELRRSLALLWGAVPEPTRGPRPGLTVDRIVAAAITLADTQGLAALSMRNLASALDVGTMTLYRYVPGRAELVALMIERVQGPGEPLADDLGWRERVAAHARGEWELYRRHPWVLQIEQGRPLMGPKAMEATEIALRAYDGTGLSPRERVAMVLLVSSFVSGLARGGMESTTAASVTGISDEEWWGAHAPYMDERVSERFPTLTGAGEAGAWEHEVQETYFAQGLARILDGIEIRVRQLGAERT